MKRLTFIVKFKSHFPPATYTLKGSYCQGAKKFFFRLGEKMKKENKYISPTNVSRETILL